MLSTTSLLLVIVLCVLIFITLIRNWLSADKCSIWSPITFISLTLIYYVVMPSLDGLSRHGADAVENQSLFYWASVIFFLSLLIGFSFRTKTRFTKWNKLLDIKHIQADAVILFLFALICYIPFRGFRTTIWADDAYIVTDREGFVSYFIDLISLFCASTAMLLAYFKTQKYKLRYGLTFLPILYLTLIFYIVGGFRIRIVYLIIAMLTMYHLYPMPRKINYPLALIVGIIVYLGFAIMDSSRQYGQGINREKLSEITLSETTDGAGENEDVCCFSIIAMDNYHKFGNYEYFEPIVNAICMPIPRAIAPWKPDGEYMRRAQIRTIGSSEGGAAFLNYVEGYISFSWFGVILYGLFMGFISRIFWDNYYYNKSSIGAILLLALFNGFCYQWISRGYLGGNFNSFIYYVILPFWLMSLFRFVKMSIKGNR